MTEDRQTFREPRLETRLPCEHERYEPPTKDEFRSVTQLLGYSGSEVARLVGIEHARTVRKWIGGESPIPFSVWRVLLFRAGLALEGDDDLSSVIASSCGTLRSAILSVQAKHGEVSVTMNVANEEALKGDQVDLGDGITIMARPG